MEERKAAQVLNEARKEYLQALEDLAIMIAKLGLSRDDALILERLIIRCEKARLAYEIA